MKIAKTMKKKFLALFSLLIGGVTLLSVCVQKPVVDGSYDFAFYESDNDNNNLKDNPAVISYHIEYKECKTIRDTLIKKESAYFFSDDSPYHLVLKNSAYGLSYFDGYFHNYLECKNGEQIDVSCSYCAVIGIMATMGNAKTQLEGLD